MVLERDRVMVPVLRVWARDEEDTEARSALKDDCEAGDLGLRLRPCKFHLCRWRCLFSGWVEL
jgi:hypothetical protein